MNFARKIFDFYREGLSEMKFGKTLWLLVIIKLALLFLVLRLFFFRPALSVYDTDEQKVRHVKENLVLPGGGIGL